MIKNKKIGYLGPNYSFSHIAAKKKFKKSGQLIPFNNFNEIIENVQNDKLDIGVIPFWNPYVETIRESQETIFKSKVIAIEVLKLKIDLYLCCVENIPLSDIKNVLSIEHVFKQCNRWLSENLSNVNIKYTTSTAKAAEEIKNMKNSAAICSKEVYQAKKLNCLSSKIQSKDNSTLFFIIEKKQDRNYKNNYCLVAIKTDTVNYKELILDIFGKHGFSTSQSFAMSDAKGKYTYLFLEFFCRYHDLDFISARTELQNMSINVKLIGTYSKSINTVWN